MSGWRGWPPLAVGMVVLAGCGGGATPAGNGVGPTAVTIAAANGTTANSAGVVRAYQCLPGSLAATLRFSDGSSGNFTARVSWTSADSSIVRVSNGDIAVPGGTGFYTAGTLIPVSPGTTTVTATYATLTAQVPVNVGTPSSIGLVAVAADGTLTPATEVRLGAGTHAQYGLSAVTDGVRRTVTSAASWAVGGGFANVDATGLVTALGTGGPATLTAQFPICTQQVSAPLTVLDIAGIQIVPAFGDAPLPLENREPVQVLARLSDGTTQDISLQTTLGVTDATVAAFSTTANATNVLQPATVGAVTITAQLNSAFTALERTINVISTPLSVIQVAPTSAVVRAGSNETARFTATGTFGNGLVQDVTLGVDWAVSNTTLATVGTTVADAGIATAAGASAGETTVTASTTRETGVSPSTATLTVDTAESPVNR